MTNAHGVARDQLRAFIERIERLEEEKKTIADDIKDVYGEAKAMGFNTKILKQVVSLRKKDDQERIEEEMVLATYLHALGMVQGDLFEEPHDPETGEVLDAKLAHTVVTGMQTETGRAALIAAVDIMIAQEEAEEHQASDDAPIVPPSPAESEAKEISASSYSRPATLAVSGGEPSIPSSDAGGEKMEGRPAAHPGRPDEQSAHTDAKSGQATNTNSPETANEMDREEMPGGRAVHSLPAENARKAVPETEDGSVTHAGAGESPATESAPASQGEAEAPSAVRVSLDEGSSADANTGGDHVTAQTSTAATAGALVRSAPAKSPLRPHCLNPGEQCGGYGTKHCRSCMAAMEEREVA